MINLKMKIISSAMESTKKIVSNQEREENHSKTRSNEPSALVIYTKLMDGKRRGEKKSLIYAFVILSVQLLLLYF